MPEAVRVRWDVEHVPPASRRGVRGRTLACVSASPAFDVAARRARIDDAIRGVDWSRIHARLLAFAFARCRSRERAEDLAQGAIRCVLDPAYAEWDPQAQPNLVRFLGSIVNRNLWNERQSARSKRDVALDDESSARLPDARGFSETAAADRDRCARGIALLRVRLQTKNDALALAVLDAVIDGAETPAAIAAELGRSVDEIVFARRRLHRAAADVTRTLSATPEEVAS
jgi:hypothetical protein